MSSMNDSYFNDENHLKTVMEKYSFKYIIYDNLKKFVELKKEPIKFSYIINKIDMPFKILRSLTIPPCEPKEYNHKKTIMWPYLGILFFLCAANLNFQPHYLYYLFLSAFLSFLF